jgi:LacI family transcriptional regulator
MISRKVDGIILSTCGKLHDYIAKISHMLPVVAIYRSIDHPDYCGDFIDSDTNVDTYTVTKHLLENGHRKIFIISGPQHVSSGYNRFNGFRRAMAEYGILVDDAYPYCYNFDYTSQGGYEGCRRLFASEDRPTALVTGNAEVLRGALSYCRSNGIRIPEDLSIVGGMQPENSNLFFTDITSVILDSEAIGKRAGQMILDRIANGNAKLKNQVIFSSQIHYGNSVKKL